MPFFIVACVTWFSHTVPTMANTLHLWLPGWPHVIDNDSTYLGSLALALAREKAPLFVQKSHRSHIESLWDGVIHICFTQEPYPSMGFSMLSDRGHGHYLCCLLPVDKYGDHGLKVSGIGVYWEAFVGPLWEIRKSTTGHSPIWYNVFVQRLHSISS